MIKKIQFNNQPGIGSFSFIDGKKRGHFPRNNQPALGSFSSMNRPSRMPDIQNWCLSLAINDSCSMGCPHCLVRDYGISSSANPLMKRRLKELNEIKNPPRFVSFAGKEPTETPERLVELAKIAKQSSETILMTNAQNLNQKLQQQLAGLIDFLDPSLDGLKNTAKTAFFADGRETPAWQNIKYAVKNNLFKKVGIIITLTANTYKKLGDLLDLFLDEFGDNQNVSATVWFYLSADKKDPLLLNEGELTEAITAATEHPYKNIRIVIPDYYSRPLLEIFEKLRINPTTRRFCSKTGVESYLLNDKILIVPSELKLLRIENDGKVFLGCNHFIDPDEKPVGDIKTMTIEKMLCAAF